MKHEIIVQKLIAHIRKILGYCDGVSYAQFSADSKLVEACVFNLSQMGELSNRIDATFAQAHPEIPWRQIYGLRNRLVHDYEGVNLLLVWQILSDDIPALRDTLISL